MNNDMFIVPLYDAQIKYTDLKHLKHTVFAKGANKAIDIADALYKVFYIVAKKEYSVYLLELLASQNIFMSVKYDEEYVYCVLSLSPYEITCIFRNLSSSTNIVAKELLKLIPSMYEDPSIFQELIDSMLLPDESKWFHNDGDDMNSYNIPNMPINDIQNIMSTVNVINISMNSDVVFSYYDLAHLSSVVFVDSKNDIVISNLKTFEPKEGIHDNYNSYLDNIGFTKRGVISIADYSTPAFLLASSNYDLEKYKSIEDLAEEDDYTE